MVKMNSRLDWYDIWTYANYNGTDGSDEYFVSYKAISYYDAAVQYYLEHPGPFLDLAISFDNGSSSTERVIVQEVTVGSVANTVFETVLEVTYPDAKRTEAV
jgi:hypothetical protein